MQYLIVVRSLIDEFLGTTSVDHRTISVVWDDQDGVDNQTVWQEELVRAENESESEFEERAAGRFSEAKAYFLTCSPKVTVSIS